MSRNHNQIYVLGMRQVHDRPSNIAFEQHSPDRHVPKLIGTELFEHTARSDATLLVPFRWHAGFAAAGNQVLQLEYMSEYQFGMESARQRLGVVGGRDGAGRKIHRQKDFR